MNDATLSWASDETPRPSKCFMTELPLLFRRECADERIRLPEAAATAMELSDAKAFA